MKKYLLERYPAIWNTQVVLLLPLIFLSHLVFFALGFIMLNDEAMSNYYYYLGDNFKELPLLLSFIIMVLLSIGWLILLFRNNAFKRFYPVSRWQLFGRFVVYLVIIFGMTSSYVSFIAGEKAKVHWRYSDSYIHSVLQQYPEDISDSEREKLSDDQLEEYYIAYNASHIKKSVFIEKFDVQIIFAIVIAFVLTILIFTVRITSLRTALLSIVFSGVLSLLLSLLTMFILHISIVTIREIYVALAILWITYFLVIGLSIFLNRKLYRGIAVNTSLFGILPIIIITFTTIAEEYDWWYFLEKNYSYWYDIKELIVLIGGILLSIGFIGLYTNVIKRWRAMPE